MSLTGTAITATTANTANTAATLPLKHSFAALPSEFYTRLMPTPLPAPYLVATSPSAAALIGLTPTHLAEQEALAVLIGNAVPQHAQPLAAVYSGHQFGVWAGQLGDGRAILMGEAETDQGPMELQWKGSGLTPYSRMGDGRAVLRSSIREFLCSEAMHALGIPSSRALSVAGSDQGVMRETVESSAVVIRMAPTFVRFGSFEHWFYNKKHDQLKLLADYVIERFFPDLMGQPKRYQLLLEEVTRRTAHMIAHWQAVGFMHGVMNTDNMSILGITLDYGPFGFMEAFDAQHICNHTDQQGRYSYAMQPQIGHWNCYALAQALLPLIGEVEAAQAALDVYQPAFAAKIDELLRAKLGLTEQTSLVEQDRELFDAMFAVMQANHVDFTLFFRNLSKVKAADTSGDEAVRDLFIDRAAFDGWAASYRQRLQTESASDAERAVAMNKVNPKYVLRNYLAQVAIEKAQNKDFTEVTRLLTVLQRPYDEQPEYETYAALPPDWASHLEVSCSS